MNKVQQGQSFIDMILQNTGDISEVIEMAILNEKSITDDVLIGEEIKITKVVNQVFVQLFLVNRPATNIIQKPDAVDVKEGIGYWFIEQDFIVS